MILCFCFSVLNFFCLTGWYDTKFFCKFVFGSYEKSVIYWK